MQFLALTTDEYEETEIGNFSKFDQNPDSLSDEERLLYAEMLLRGIKNHRNVVNPEKGIEFLQRVATSAITSETSYAAQKLHFEILYFGFKTIEQDQEEAITVLDQYAASTSRIANAVCSYAASLKSIEPEKSAIFYRIAADAGVAYAQYNYGLMLEEGDGISTNKPLAAHYYKLAADQGHADAQFNYGWMLFNGYGIPMDKSLAAHYFKLSADQGNIKGQNNYGVILERGYGIPMDKSLAAHYYRLAADQGDTIARASYDRIISSVPTPAPVQTTVPAPTSAPVQTTVPAPTSAPVQTTVPVPTPAPVQTTVPAPTSAPTSAPAPVPAPESPAPVPAPESPALGPAAEPAPVPEPKPKPKPEPEPEPVLGSAPALGPAAELVVNRSVSEPGAGVGAEPETGKPSTELVSKPPTESLQPNSWIKRHELEVALGVALFGVALALIIPAALIFAGVIASTPTIGFVLIGVAAAASLVALIVYAIIKYRNSKEPEKQTALEKPTAVEDYGQPGPVQIDLLQ